MMYNQKSNNDGRNGLASKASHRINSSLANLKTLHGVSTASSPIKKTNKAIENVVERYVR